MNAFLSFCLLSCCYNFLSENIWPYIKHKGTSEREFYNTQSLDLINESPKNNVKFNKVCVCVSDCRDVCIPAQRGGDPFPDELWGMSEEDAHQPQRSRVQRYRTHTRTRTHTCTHVHTHTRTCTHTHTHALTPRAVCELINSKNDKLETINSHIFIHIQTHNASLDNSLSLLRKPPLIPFVTCPPCNELPPSCQPEANETPSDHTSSHTHTHISTPFD